MGDIVCTALTGCQVAMQIDYEKKDKSHGKNSLRLHLQVSRRYKCCAKAHSKMISTTQ